tara:strand:- start:198 stop:458 length:261 start_codon:yes stop_codon:yes gene_type:complete
MCGGLFGGNRRAPDPPPLAPPPPPPVAPPPPTPEAEPLVTEVNPQVRRAKSKKAKSQLAKGSGQLRIPLDPKVNTPTAGPTGGLNT